MITRPTITAVMLGAAPATAAPTTKTKQKKMSTHLMLKMKRILRAKLRQAKKARE